MRIRTHWILEKALQRTAARMFFYNCETNAMGVNLVALFPDPFFTINPHEDGCAHLFRGGGNKQYALEPAIAEY